MRAAAPDADWPARRDDAQVAPIDWLCWRTDVVDNLDGFVAMFADLHSACSKNETTNVFMVYNWLTFQLRLKVNNY
jgi:hypothetical protein